MNLLDLMSRSIREGALQLMRNTFLSGTTIALGVLILFLMNVIFSVQFLVEYQLSDIESRADFAVFLRENLDSFEFDALANELKTYDVALDIIPEQTIDSVAFPPRLQIVFEDLEQVESVFEVLKKVRYDTVIGQWDTEGEREFVTVIQNLLRIRNGIDEAGFWLTILFVLGGVMLMINTFGMVLFARKDEIHVARLVGAKPSFIMGPFIVEGILMGVLASLISVGVTVFVLTRITVLPAGDIFVYLLDQVFATEILLASGVGAFGAWVSARKYLRGRLR